MLGTLLPFVIAIPPGLPSVSSMGPSLDACFFTCRGVAFATQSEWISRMKIPKYTLDSLCFSQCMTYPGNVFYVRAWSRISVPCLQQMSRELRVGDTGIRVRRRHFYAVPESSLLRPLLVGTLLGFSKDFISLSDENTC